jgi:hypothetical protein
VTLPQSWTLRELTLWCGNMRACSRCQQGSTTYRPHHHHRRCCRNRVSEQPTQFALVAAAVAALRVFEMGRAAVISLTCKQPCKCGWTYFRQTDTNHTVNTCCRLPTAQQVSMPAQQAHRQQQANAWHRPGHNRYGKAGALQRHNTCCAPSAEGRAVLKAWLRTHHLHAPPSCVAECGRACANTFHV